MMGTEKGVQGGGPPPLFLFIDIYLAMLGLGCSPWDHVPTQGWTWAPAWGAWSFGLWTTREVPGLFPNHALLSW